MKRLIIILALVLAAISNSACAAAADGYLPLDKLTSYGLANSPDLAAAAAAVKSAEQLAPQVNSLPDPVFGINYQSDQLTPNLTGELSWLMLSASQEIVLPGKLRLRRQIAELGFKKATADLRAAQSDLVGKIAESYIGLALTDKKADILHKRQQLADELIAAATARYRTGTAEQQDVLLAQKAKYELQLQAEQLQSELLGQKHQLMNLSGMTGGDGQLSVRMPDIATLDDDSDALAKLAGQQSAALAAQKILWDSKLLEVKLGEEDRFPDYTLSAGISVAGGMPGMWNAGLQVSVPLNLANRQNRAIAQAEAEATLAAAQYTSQRLALNSSIYGNYAAYNSAKRTLKIYNESLIALGRQTYTASLIGYSTGKSTISNTLDQLNTALDYETGYWEQYTAMLQARARLLALCNANLDAYSKKGREQ